MRGSMRAALTRHMKGVHEGVHEGGSHTPHEGVEGRWTGRPCVLRVFGIFGSFGLFELFGLLGFFGLFGLLGFFGLGL